MNRLNPRTLSLVGFAASEWAGERLNGSRHRRQYRQLIAAGLEAALRQVINHAWRAVR